MRKIRVTETDNAVFLKKVAPFQKENKIYSSAHVLKCVTGLNHQRLYRMLNYNGLTIEDGSKYVRKKQHDRTLKRVEYIRKRIAEEPDITMQQLGEELNCSKQSVCQLIHRYGI